MKLLIFLQPGPEATGCIRGQCHSKYSPPQNCVVPRKMFSNIW